MKVMLMHRCHDHMNIIQLKHADYDYGTQNLFALHVFERITKSDMTRPYGLVVLLGVNKSRSTAILTDS